MRGRYRLRLQLMAVRLEFFAGRFEGATTGRILMAEGASFACLLRVGRRGVGDVGQSQRHRACNQYCDCRAANEDDEPFCARFLFHFSVADCCYDHDKPGHEQQ